MSSVLTEVLAANAVYAAQFGDKAKLPAPPSRKFAILTCMDARLDPAKYAGFGEGEAHVIRNAGGRASDDAIRSLVLSYKLLGTREWFVIHHTDCGMARVTDESIRDLFSNSMETGSSSEGSYINWLTIKDPEQSLVDDVRRIRNHPLVPGDIPIYGYIFDVRSGRLLEIPEAMAAGKAVR